MSLRKYVYVLIFELRFDEKSDVIGRSSGKDARHEQTVKDMRWRDTAI